MKFKYKAMAFLAVLVIIILVFLIMQKTDYMASEHATIDFTKETGRISINYGANEDDNWIDFADAPEIHDFHGDVNSQYIRVWVSSQSYRKSTIPPYQDGSYDFTNINKFINAVIKADAIPFVVFAHAPGTFDEGHGQPPPESDEEFADYVATVVEHFKDVCNDGKYAKPCDVNDWYFEIWNEPSGNTWWDEDLPRYAALFNQAYEKIKAIAPNAKVGGYSLTFFKYSRTERLKMFLQNADMDFVSIHHYGNAMLYDVNEKQKIMNIKSLLYDSPIALRSLINKHKPGRDIEIINSEYNSDHRAEFMPRLDEKFTAAWYASALIWQIKSQEIDMELFYSGTSNFPNGGFGMWSKNHDGSFRLWPVYHMKKLFVKYNKKGDFIFDSKYDSDNIDVLAVDNNGRRFITIVNKCDNDNLINLKIRGTNSKQLVDLNTQKKYSIVDNTVQINLKPYEVRFFEVI